MTSSGLALDTALITSIQDVMTGIATTVMNVGPQLLLIGLGVWGALVIVNKIPSWIKRFVG